MLSTSTLQARYTQNAFQKPAVNNRSILTTNNRLNVTFKENLNQCARFRVQLQKILNVSPCISIGVYSPSVCGASIKVREYEWYISTSVYYYFVLVNFLRQQKQYELHATYGLEHTDGCVRSIRETCKRQVADRQGDHRVILVILCSPLSPPAFFCLTEMSVHVKDYKYLNKDEKGGWMTDWMRQGYKRKWRCPSSVYSHSVPHLSPSNVLGLSYSVATGDAAEMKCDALHFPLEDSRVANNSKDTIS